MQFEPTSIPGAVVIDVAPHADERGSLARIFCARELAEHGMESAVAQANLSVNRRAGTLRGLHYQREPAAEAKLVRCVRGSAFDVAVDLRDDSPTRLGWVGVELSATNRRALFIPKGCAHGFQTLEDETELIYFTSDFYTPEAEGGVHYADPLIGVQWPRDVTAISAKDAAWPRLAPGPPA